MSDYLPIPLQSPSIGDCSITINSEYIPIIVGGLTEYLYSDKWDGTASEQEQAVQWIYELIRLLMECNTMSVSYHLPLHVFEPYNHVGTLQLLSDVSGTKPLPHFIRSWPSIPVNAGYIHPIYLDTGTYKLTWLLLKYADRGKWNIGIEGVYTDLVDLYNTTLQSDIEYVQTITINNVGQYNVIFTYDSSNPSSSNTYFSGFYVNISKL